VAVSSEGAEEERDREKHRTVFLEVTLNVKGEAEEIKVLRNLPPFTAEAKAVVEEGSSCPPLSMAIRFDPIFF
jgi:hypothetical protein